MREALKNLMVRLLEELTEKIKTDKYDYVSSIVHEAEHVKQSILKAYNVPDEDEAPAYTIGFLVMKMMEFYMKFLCR